MRPLDKLGVRLYIKEKLLFYSLILCVSYGVEEAAVIDESDDPVVATDEGVVDSTSSPQVEASVTGE